MPEPSGEMEAGPEMRGGEGVWPESVAAVEGAWSVDVAQNSLISMRDGSEEVCPRGVAVVEGAWSVARAPNSLVSIRDGSEEVCPRGVATVDGAWSVGGSRLSRLCGAAVCFPLRSSYGPAEHTNISLTQEETQLPELQEEQRGSPAKHVTLHR